MEADMKARSALVMIAMPLLAALSTYASTFYVNALGGSDSNLGTAPSSPWKTLEKVNTHKYEAGDRILLRAGSRWEGHLVLSISGAIGAPIVVDRYGEGSLPRMGTERSRTSLN
jgi:hypothetical protein